jgi:hypothetical protein
MTAERIDRGDVSPEITAETDGSRHGTARALA